MAKRASKEEIVLTFFRESPLVVANSIFNLVKGELKKRNDPQTVGGGQAGGPVKVRKPRKKKTPATSSTPAATSFNTETMGA